MALREAFERIDSRHWLMRVLDLLWSTTHSLSSRRLRRGQAWLCWRSSRRSVVLSMQISTNSSLTLLTLFQYYS